MQLGRLSRPGISVPPSGRTRYARSSDPEAWLHAPKNGFVGAIIESVEDGRNRVLLAWPSRPDNGFVAVALALREARATGRLAYGTLAVWPWRRGATHAARSIRVHVQDILNAARRAHTDVDRRASWTASKLAHGSLCLVELRLNDVAPRKRRVAEDLPNAPPADDQSSPTPKARDEGSGSPTLLETTAVFAPADGRALSAYEPDAEQILSRVRRRTTLGTILPHLEAAGSPLTAPFAIMGLAPGQTADIARCLNFERFSFHGLDAVVVDLTRTARTILNPDWQPQLVELLAALRDAQLPRRPPVIVLCEDALVMRRAEGAFRKANAEASDLPLRQGAFLPNAGILESPSLPVLPELSDITFEVDVKDATLVPLRERLLQLMRRLRDAGLGMAARAVGTGLRALSTFASLPVGLDEGRSNAEILFAGDGRDEIDARSGFFPTSALQPMADAQNEAPAFGEDIRALLVEIRARLDTWKEATPVSLKMAQLMRDRDWNRPDVLLVLPNARTVDVFTVSNGGLPCTCTIVDSSRLADRTSSRWRRIIVVKSRWRSVRDLLTMENAPERVLFLSDAAGASLIGAELGPLATFPAFSRFAKRARALSSALISGGAEEALDLAEAEFRYPDAPSEDLVDLTQAPDDYTGDVLRFHLAGGCQVAYRPGGDILLFTPDESRPFRRSAARDVRPGDSILVLNRDVRDRLSEAFARSRKTAVQLKTYHEHVARYCEQTPGQSSTARARDVLAVMRTKDPSLGDNELQNVKRWLSVQPSDQHQRAQAARDRRRFALFIEAIGIPKMLGDAFWDFAVLPSRRYSAHEGHLFNRRIVHFVLDPEGIACGTRCREYDGLWQAIMDSVDEVVERTVSHG